MTSKCDDHDPTEVDEAAVIAGQLNAVNARLVAHTARLLPDEGWRQGGKRTPAAYLAWKFGLSSERASIVVTVAERSDEFPHLFAAFEHGELSIEQVAEAVKAPAWADADVLDFCRIATPAKIRRAMHSNMFEHDPDQPEPATPAPTDRVSFGIGRDGRWRINANLGIDDGRRIQAALGERKDALFDSGNDKASWVDAFTDCFDRSLAAGDRTSSVHLPGRQRTDRRVLVADRPARHRPPGVTPLLRSTGAPRTWVTPLEAGGAE